MTPNDILVRLDNVGAKLIAKPPDGKLVILARKGVVTPELVALVASHKDELRKLLNPNGNTSPEEVNGGRPGSDAADFGTPADAPGTDAFAQEVERWKVTFNATVPESRHYPAPLPLYPVKLVFSGKQVGLTLVRHNCAGVNRFGQEAADFPYAAINLPAWKLNPFDPARVTWYRSRGEVGAVCPTEILTEPEDRGTCASFAGGVSVELRLKGRRRWAMWIREDGLLRLRKDFATPYLDHARRCAEHFYGAPISGWREPSLPGKEQVCPRT